MPFQKDFRKVSRKSIESGPAGLSKMSHLVERTERGSKVVRHERGRTPSGPDARRVHRGLRSTDRQRPFKRGGLVRQYMRLPLHRHHEQTPQRTPVHIPSRNWICRGTSYRAPTQKFIPKYTHFGPICNGEERKMDGSRFHILQGVHVRGRQPYRSRTVQHL